MRLQIRHKTTYDYEPAAERVALRLRLYPSQFDGQQTSYWRVSVNEKEILPLLTTGFGDQIGVYLHHNSPTGVEILAEGEIETEDRSGIVRGLLAHPPKGIFLRQTDLTEVDDAIRDLGESAARQDPLDELHQLAQLLREMVEYKPGVTSMETTAADSLRLGAGVCQDHTHIFIAAARSRGHPARYVTGYQLDHEKDDDLHQTHAWAEAYTENIGWIGFDVSNAVCPTDAYVRLGCGLDAQDSAPIRGAVLGETIEILETSVNIKAIQSQSQQ